MENAKEEGVAIKALYLFNHCLHVDENMSNYYLMGR